MTVVLSWMVGCQEDGVDRARQVPDVVLRDEHNYRAAPSLELGTVEVMAGADVCVDWSAVTSSQPPPVVFLMEYRLPLAVLREELATEELGTSGVSAWPAGVRVGDTVTCVSEFEVLGTPLDPRELGHDPDRTWVFTVPVGSCEALSPSVVLQSRDAATAQAVTLTDTTSAFTFVADLGAGAPLEATAGPPPVLDWSGLAHEASGGRFVPRADDRLRIARFDETEVDALADDVLDLEASADELYTTDVFGLTYVSLGHAIDREGGPFAGFTTSGTWLVAIDSAECARRPPMALAVVSVAP